MAQSMYISTYLNYANKPCYKIDILVIYIINVNNSVILTS